MSTQQFHPTYVSASGAMLAVLTGSLQKITIQEAGQLLIALTLRGQLPMKTLGFAALALLLDRYLSGVRPATKGSYGIGAGLRLSGVSSDQSELVTYDQLSLLHDVLAEFPMSQRRLWSLNAYLRERHGAALATSGDCDCCIVPASRLTEYHERVADDENLRARLGSRGPVRLMKGGPVIFRTHTDHEQTEIDLVTKIHTVAASMVLHDRFNKHFDDLAVEHGIQRALNAL